MLIRGGSMGKAYGRWNGWGIEEVARDRPRRLRSGVHLIICRSKIVYYLILRTFEIILYKISAVKVFIIF